MFLHKLEKEVSIWIYFRNVFLTYKAVIIKSIYKNCEVTRIAGFPGKNVRSSTLALPLLERLDGSL